MKTILLTRRAGLSLAATCVLLAGCAAPKTPPLYQWTGYQRGVYDYFKAEKSPQQQLDALEKALQDIRAHGHRPPPGFEAQLGVLYAELGNGEQAMQAFQAEKDSFPEAAPYMDFLMKKSAGKAPASDTTAAASVAPEPAGLAAPTAPTATH
ncbi:DUF4810 domain-containing protein [Burkholderia sp. 22PA0106]|uniref:DUF4810 domain-containing protein n=1 Tax=Burkholderia sp. 22PA0106 TaxID=3237371 RepID=UPI0039C1095D